MTTRRQMTEGEVNAEIERVQQTITLKLQHIDENFARSNHIVTTQILPEIDRFAKATHQIWERSKVWLYFFKSMSQGPSAFTDDDQSSYFSNRPTFEDTSPNWRLSHDMTKEDMTDYRTLRGLFRKNLQQPPSASSLDTSTRYHLPPTNIHTFSTISTSTSDSANTPAHSRLTTSPPRTINFGISTSELQRTPIREAAVLLTEDRLRSVGIRSSDDDDDTDPFNPRPAPASTSAKPSGSSSSNKPWETSNMDVETTESRAKFEKFFHSRQQKFKDMPPGKELDTIREPARSPSSRESRTREIGVLVSTPTMQRVINNKQLDLRQSSPLKRSRESDTEEEERRSVAEFQTSFDFEARLGEDDLQQQDEIMMETGAIEFSDAMPQEGGYRQNKQMSIGDSTATSMTGNSFGSKGDMTGTSKIPVKFGLQHFSEAFRTPPGSTLLTRVYETFEERPGEMLTLENVINSINDSDYNEGKVLLLINLLTSKRFLKKVGDHQAWVVRK